MSRGERFTKDVQVDQVQDEKPGDRVNRVILRGDGKRNTGDGVNEDVVRCIALLVDTSDSGRHCKVLSEIG